MYTCLTCNVVFEDVDLWRAHFKTDWHRYNLKRKVVNLGPITYEKFQERVALQEKQEQESNNSQETCYHEASKKVFKSANALENYLQSKKCKDAMTGKNKKNKKSKNKKPVKKQVNPIEKKPIPLQADTEEDAAMSDEEEDIESDAESWDSYDENCLGMEASLFDSHVSENIEENLSYMSKEFGFFLPDAEYISDLEGLMTYLGEKVGAGCVCLWCGKTFRSTKDVQRHMVDKGHCKILYEGDAVAEFADFYDYTSSYPDREDKDVDPDEIVSPEELESDGFSLTLPSGAQIGHRSLLKYYRQNLVPHSRGELVVYGGKRLPPKLLQHYKALGWTGTTGPAVEQRVKDVRFVQRFKKQYHMQLGVKGNKLRHRFRNPNGPLC